LADAAAGRRLPSLAVALAYVRACEGDVGEWERRWYVLAADLAEIPETESDVAGQAPYVGLAAYQADDAEWFFGRERMVDELVAQVRTQRFVAVVGPSGAGKSSLLRAGLVPRLTAGRSVMLALFTPGPHPVEECAVHVARLLGGMPGAVTAELTADPRNLHRIVRQILADEPLDAEVVLIIDQFEEVFSLCQGAAERRLLVAALVDATGATNSRCRVVLGVRADFYSHCLLDPDLAMVFRDHQVVVGPMSVDELRSAIVQPARRVNCSVEGSLLAELITHAHGRAGVLPLLSHALLETWRRRQGNALTAAAFERTGGIDGALVKTAEDVFTSLDHSQQETARHLFLRLVVLGEGTQDTKRRVRRDELDEETDEVLDRLGSARLVVLAEDSVEITHEALISAWPRLQTWLVNDREGQRVHRQLTEATATWIDHDRDPGTLLRGARLAIVKEWARGHHDANRAERAFLDVSVAAEHRERASARRRVRLMLGLIAILVVLVVVATTAALYAIDAQQTAAHQRNVAVALNAVRASSDVVTTNPALAAEISLAAYRLHPSRETGDNLVANAAAATRIPLNAPGVVAIAPSGRLVAAADSRTDTTALSAISERGVTPVATLQGGMFSARFSADNRTVATVDQHAVPRLWNISDPSHPGKLATIPAKAVDFVFSPDGSLLATTDAIPTPPNGELPTPIDEQPRWGGGAAARLWDIRNPTHPRELGILADSHPAITMFGNTGKTIATIRFGTTMNGPTTSEIGLWDVSAPRAPTLATKGFGSRDQWFATFTNKDQVLYTVDSNGVIRVWDISTLDKPRAVRAIRGYRAATSGMTSDPATHKLITSSGKGGLTVWDISDSLNPQKIVDLPLYETNLGALSISKDGETIEVIAYATGKTTLVRWHLDPDRAASTVCKRTAPRMTESDWRIYFNDLPYQPPCDPTP
jgi:energy-coupling factor transporter ATP-binding protein EcfA2